MECLANVTARINIETHYSSRPPVPPIIVCVPSRVYSRAVVRITIAELFRLERETSIRKTAS